MATSQCFSVSFTKVNNFFDFLFATLEKEHFQKKICLIEKKLPLEKHNFSIKAKIAYNFGLSECNRVKRIY